MQEWEWHLVENRTELNQTVVQGVELKPGDRVWLRPQRGGDIFDLVLAGKLAVIESLEQDYENKIHVAVVVEDDPGQDLGHQRLPGHRFFFSIEEIEPWRDER